VPVAVRGGLVGRPRRVRRPLGRCVLGLARADEVDRQPPPDRVLGVLGHVPGAGRRDPPRPPGPVLLRPVPRRSGAFRAARAPDVARSLALLRRDDGARDLAGRRRPAGAAAALARLSRAERGPALAAAAPPSTASEPS